MLNQNGRRLGISIVSILALGWGQASHGGKPAQVTQGEFPIEKVISINSGYFRNGSSLDLLVTHEAGTVKISTGFQYRTGKYAMRQLTLLSFTNGKFEIFWQSPAYIANSSPHACIYSPVWSHGNFDQDSLLELVELENGFAYFHDFDQGVASRKTMESKEGAMGHAIGWNFDEKGEEEILALKYIWDEPEENQRPGGGPGSRPGRGHTPGVECRPLPKRGYRISVLSLAGGKVAEVWAKDFLELTSSGPTGSTGLFGKMILDGSGALHPVLIAPQSDVSGSKYLVVSKTKAGNAVELTQPFPGKGDILPIGNLTFLQYKPSGTTVHGTFLNTHKEMKILKTMGVFQNGKWSSPEPCDIEMPGTIGKFADGNSPEGWIYVHEGKFRIWKELPKCKSGEM